MSSSRHQPTAQTKKRTPIPLQVLLVIGILAVEAAILMAVMPANSGQQAYEIRYPIEDPTVVSLAALAPSTAGEPKSPSEEEEENQVPRTDEVAEEADPPEPINMAPVEKTGGEGNPEERLPTVDQAPEAVVDSCEHYHPAELTPEMIVKAKDGPSKTSFAVEIDGLVNEWTVMTVMRMPGETFTVDLIESDAGSNIKFASEDGYISYESASRWTWRAPTIPGIYCVRLENRSADETMCIHVAVLNPLDEEDEEFLNGYRIGSYKKEPFRNNPRYTAPEGFIEVTEENQNTWLSPHFQLKQFVCKQQGSFPKYVLVETRLLVKLELLIDSLEKEGIRTDGLYLLSAFRTPYYNEAIGNKTFYSRHLYGDAADLFVDSNGDGKLDDLDGDGEITLEDAKILQKAVKGITARPIYRQLIGGLGLYDKKNYRNPFIHVDTRGYRAEWSQ